MLPLARLKKKNILAVWWLSGSVLSRRFLAPLLSVDKDCLPFVYARRSKPVEMLAEY